MYERMLDKYKELALLEKDFKVIMAYKPLRDVSWGYYSER